MGYRFPIKFKDRITMQNTDRPIVNTSTTGNKKKHGRKVRENRISSLSCERGVGYWYLSDSQWARSMSGVAAH